MSSRSQQQRLKVDEISFFEHVTTGLGELNWWTLVFLGASILALLIAHIVVLINVNAQLPQYNSTDSYPADNIAIVDLTFVSILFVGILSAFLDFNNVIKTIQLSIKRDPDASAYHDPELEDIREESQISKSSFQGGEEAGTISSGDNSSTSLTGGNLSAGAKGRRRRKDYSDAFLSRLFGQPVKQTIRQ